VQRLETRLDGPVLLQPIVHGDERGFFLETYRRSALAELGIVDEFVQDNHSRSRGGVVRGMHFQPGMAKLIRCARGVIYDVVVDLRRGSPTFGQWEGAELSDANHHQFYCPDGFAHGFCVLSELAEVEYKCTDYYDRADEVGARWDSAGIDWPIRQPLLSPKDAALPTLAELRRKLES
jgi:dTDP-4-dehydrorhamnose 3,5-epimerase